MVDFQEFEVQFLNHATVYPHFINVIGTGRERCMFIRRFDPDGREWWYQFNFSTLKHRMTVAKFEQGAKDYLLEDREGVWSDWTTIR